MLQAKQILQQRYQLQQQLGRTAAGRQTWLAIDLQSNEKVIIKLLAFSPQMEWEELKLFEREAQVLASLNHPRIPHYRDYFSLNQQLGAGLPWFALVQNYIPGKTLQELLQQGECFTETQVKKIAIQILEILVYLHKFEPPVLHRDIKPSNLIWGEDEQIYLVDFGAVQDKAALTGVTFTVVGTCGYAPLEQFWGKAVPASDLYALGATLIHLITGISPVDLPQKDSRIQFSHLVNLSGNFVSWIETLVEPAIEKRFYSAEQALEILKYGKTIRSNNKGLATRKISQPDKTLIKLNKTRDKLEIEIPAGGRRKLKKFGIVSTVISAIAVFYLGISFIKAILPITLSMAPLGFLFWTAILLGIIRYFGERTYIYLDHNRFELERQTLNFRYGKQGGKIADILGVFLYSNGSTYELVHEVTIRTEGNVYQLGGALTEKESAWLAQEIQDWINYK